MGASGGSGGGGMSQALGPVGGLLQSLFGSRAKPGQPPQAAPAGPAPVHPLIGPAPQEQNPLTAYIMALSRMS